MGERTYNSKKVEVFNMTLHYSAHLLDKINTSLQNCVFSGRVFFAIQSGESWNLTNEDIFTRCSAFGRIDYVVFSTTSKDCGTVKFSNGSDGKKILNMVMDVNGCLLHFTTKFSDLSPFPEGHQVLVESDRFPTNWERKVTIRNFFGTFGEVSGVYITRNRLIVSFKEDIASQITGTLIQVPWDHSLILVREVSRLTVGSSYNSTGTRPGD